MADQSGTGGAGTPAGWYPDPQGRYEQRYHDGAAWTAHVNTGGTSGIDDGPMAAAAPVGGALGGAPTGASLYGSPSGPYAPAAAGHFSATPQMPGHRPQRKEKNRIGAGLLVAVGGWLLIAAATVLPWFGDANLFDLPPTYLDSTYSGYSGTDYSPFLVLQVIFTMLWFVLAIVCTTLPLQPGKVLGFFFGGCIGLAVCWRPVDHHDRTMRANILGIVLVAAALFRLWLAVDQVHGRVGEAFTDLGAGPYVATFGYIVIAVGMLLGRRRVLADV